MSYSYLHLSSHASYYLDFLTSFDGGYIHQGCWSWGGDVAGTAVSRTLQIRGPGNTHREVTYYSWAAPQDALYNSILSVEVAALGFEAVRLALTLTHHDPLSPAAASWPHHVGGR